MTQEQYKELFVAIRVSHDTLTRMVKDKSYEKDKDYLDVGLLAMTNISKVILKDYLDEGGEEKVPQNPEFMEGFTKFFALEEGEKPECNDIRPYLAVMITNSTDRFRKTFDDLGRPVLSAFLASMMAIGTGVGRYIECEEESVSVDNTYVQSIFEKYLKLDK